MFSQIFDAIEEWMRELLTGMITSNLDTMFTDVNQKTGEIATQVGQTPQGWNGSIFSMIRNLSDSVIMPIAGIGIFALLFLVIAVSLGSCSASIEGAGSVIGITTYPSSDEDIYAAENQYAALESALNQQINEMERRHPNYDEYQYNI